ncbi:MAG: hypothetical protein GY705_19695 [Bacteroidetes bacterium]|nr:hypothetical protein [Bacteroidota bacterium]
MDQKEAIEIQKRVKPYKTLLASATDTILDQDVSSYPIFVVSREEVSIGIPLFGSDQMENDLSINASTLEELTTRQVVDSMKVENFKKIFKNPRKFLCLFLVSKLGATFVFLPRK